jgi:hypothetical protein
MNIEQMSESASAYRYQRLMELLNANGKNTVQKTINILRDRKGLKNADIGDGNEKAINQLIAHHSIVFEPKKLLVWVSTSPWQLGQYVCYDLSKVFALKGMTQDIEIIESSRTIAADSFLLTNEYRNFEKFRNYKRSVSEGREIHPDSIVASNPQLYNAYVVAADYLYNRKDYQKAKKYYLLALTKVVATKVEEQYINEQVKKVEKHIK